MDRPYRLYSRESWSYKVWTEGECIEMHNKLSRFLFEKQMKWRKLLFFFSFYFKIYLLISVGLSHEISLKLGGYISIKCSQGYEVSFQCEKKELTSNVTLEAILKILHRLCKSLWILQFLQIKTQKQSISLLSCFTAMSSWNISVLYPKFASKILFQVRRRSWRHNGYVSVTFRK